jgi:hypothetical protein
MIEKHTAVFLGKKVKKKYYAFKGYVSEYEDFNTPPYIHTEYELIEHVKITETQMDNPPLKEEEFIYISEYNEKAEILEVVRSTDNKYIYYLDYNVEVIEDEETEKSKEKAEKDLIIYKEEYEKKLKEKSVNSSTNNKRWSLFK